MKKWLIVFGTTFTAGMLLILAVGMLGQSLRGDNLEKNSTEITVETDDEGVSESAETDATDDPEVEEVAVDVQEEEPDPVDDPSLVWKYEGIENTVDPSEVRIAIYSGKNEYYKDMFIDSNHFKRSWLLGYTDGQPTIALTAQDLLDYKPASISGSHMEEGLHSLELVQYEDPDEPKEEEIIFYVRTTYEIK
ncbi:hypothetical protein [Enterococcus sp. RIT-PI-f]|uniref:hypothetical protein n=1 Tax=Enterococcus sp. RIT-PI-f TaxID=1690244 RepID=UPI003564D4BC